jgi:hypothetical protein
MIGYYVFREAASAASRRLLLERGAGALIQINRRKKIWQ